MSFSHAVIHEDNFSHLAGSLSRDEFVTGCDFPFLIVGHDQDFGGNAGPAEFDTTKPVRKMPPHRQKAFATANFSTRPDGSMPPIAEVAPPPPLGERAPSGVFPIRKSDRNPYSDRISIGRSKSCDIVIPSTHISKLHAHFLKTRDGSWEVRDADSRNGTFVNGAQVKPSTRARLQSGDVVRFAFIDTHFLDAIGLYDWLRTITR